MNIQSEEFLAARRAGREGLMSIHEARTYIDDLKELPLTEVGSSNWMKQREKVDKLNAQAHHNASLQKEEFVMQELIDYEKLEVLVHELLVIEIWKEKVYPKISTQLAKVSPIKAYYLSLYEGTLVNLFECLFFHEQAILGCGDSLLELTDYIYRKLVWLNNNATPPDAASKSRENAIQWQIGMQCLTLARYLIDNIDKLSISVAKRLVDTNDLLPIIVGLLEKRPWLKKEGKVWSKYSGSDRWSPTDDLMKLSIVEGQIWLALHGMLTHPTAQRIGGFDTEFRKDLALKLRPYLVESLLDQLPLLSDSARFLDTLAVSGFRSQEGSKPNVVIETLPEIRDKLESLDFDSIAKTQIAVFSAQSEGDKRAEFAKLAEMYTSSDFAELVDDPNCGVCGKPAPKRCGACQHAWYCSLACQKVDWKKGHKKLCSVLKEAKNRKNTNNTTNNINISMNKAEKSLIQEISTKKA